MIEPDRIKELKTTFINLARQSREYHELRDWIDNLHDNGEINDEELSLIMNNWDSWLPEEDDYGKQRQYILELMEIIDDLKADLASEIECDNNCSKCSYRDCYLGADDKLHYEDTCTIRKAKNKIKELEEKGYDY